MTPHDDDKSPIDPGALKRRPPRSIKEIATDIFCFPMQKDPAVPFDSSMRLKPVVVAGQPAPDTFGLHLDNLVENAPGVLAAGGGSLLDKLTAGKLPRKPRPEKQTASTTLAYSDVAVGKFRDALFDMMHSGVAKKSDVAVIQSVAYPMVELMAREYTELAEETQRFSGDAIFRVLSAGADGKENPDAMERHKKQDEEAVAHYGVRARNFREGIMPLVEELAQALNITLNKHVAIS